MLEIIPRFAEAVNVAQWTFKGQSANLPESLEMPRMETRLRSDQALMIGSSEAFGKVGPELTFDFNRQVVVYS